MPKFKWCLFPIKSKKTTIISNPDIYPDSDSNNLSLSEISSIESNNSQNEEEYTSCVNPTELKLETIVEETIESNIVPEELHLEPIESNIVTDELHLEPIESNIVPEELHLETIESNIVTEELHLEPIESNIVPEEEYIYDVSHTDSKLETIEEETPSMISDELQPIYITIDELKEIIQPLIDTTETILQKLEMINKILESNDLIHKRIIKDTKVSKTIA